MKENHCNANEDWSKLSSIINKPESLSRVIYLCLDLHVDEVQTKTPAHTRSKFLGKTEDQALK